MQNNYSKIKEGFKKSIDGQKHFMEHFNNGGTVEDFKPLETSEKVKQETLEEAAKEFVLSHDFSKLTNPNHLANRCFQFGAKWQSERMYSEEDMSEAHFQGWVTRERFDDLSPDIIYPQGLDYEEKREYAFNLWLDKYKKK
jgi:hypothetical protein